MGPLDSPQEAVTVKVDFILYEEIGLFAFEIKRKRNYSFQDLKALKSFAKDYPTAKLFLLYGGMMNFMKIM